MTPNQLRRATRQLKRLWKLHDQCERRIIRLERRFSDAQLKRLGAAGAP